MGGVTSWYEFWKVCKWGGILIGIILIVVWAFGMGCDFEWEFFKCCFYGFCALVFGLISGFIAKKIE